MGVFDNELILPGTITEIVSDYSYGYDTSQFGSTDSVTIVGTAFNGPVGKPVEIYSPEHAKYIFGSSYDSRTRKEATLVAEIQDAWDRGCRTIYAVRVSGKSISKDFQLAPETKLKLRVSGMFPSNENKDIYMTYNDTLGASKISFYKPSKRATIQEKLQGMVETEDSILVTTLDLSNSYGITKDSRLVELLKLFNDHTFNNVIRLTIVDEYGNDVTISSKEAQALSVGAMFAGAYFIGRSENYGLSTTDLTYVFVNDAGTNKPYDTFEGKVYKKLVLNSDVNADLPIAGDITILNQKFAGRIIMSSLFDFLSVPGKVDTVFGKDTVDYEEVDISDFDLYKRLGSGFAVTAKAEYKDPADPARGIKIKETPVSDPNRIAALQDGVYSMIENLKSDYRILANGVADAPISGKIPKKEDFKIAAAKATKILDNNILATAKVNPKDLTEAKVYKFKLASVASDYGQAATVKAGLFTDKVIKRVATVATIDALTADGMVKKYDEGTLFLVGTAPNLTLHRYTGGQLVALALSAKNTDLNKALFMTEDGTVYEASTVGTEIAYTSVKIAYFNTKTYALVQSGKNVSVYSIAGGAIPATDPAVFEPVGSLDEIFGDNEDKTLVTIQDEFASSNTITIKSAALDFTTLEEFVEILNSDRSLAQLFTFSIADTAVAVKDEYVAELAIPSTVGAEITNKTLAYDMSLYIPYKTTDNFARHLAQHCTYTGLKTAPTHGIIGCTRLLDVNLTSVANRVDSVAGLDMNLYAKKSNGKDMLDRNNMPYPIGKNISVVIGQYAISLDDGYTYISNGAAGYAGMISVLPLDQSSTSQPINIPNPMYDFTNFQLEKLTQKGFVTFKQSYTKGYVVTDGITMADSTSPYRRLSVTRIVNSIEEVIRAATEPFIGKQNHLANRNSMQTAIKSALDKLKGKLIEGFEFTLVVDSNNTQLGIIDIDYAIVPIYEIREVRNRISVKKAS